MAFCKGAYLFLLDKDPCNIEALKQFVDSCIWLGSGETNPDRKWLYIVEAHEMWHSCYEIAVERGNNGTEIADIYEMISGIVEDDMYS